MTKDDRMTDSAAPHNDRMKEDPLKEKSLAFAVEIVKVAKQLRDDGREFALADQLLRSGTSIGPNLAEARYAASKRLPRQMQDFPEGMRRDLLLAAASRPLRTPSGGSSPVPFRVLRRTSPHAFRHLQNA